jgi:hypothetical protein
MATLECGDQSVHCFLYLRLTFLLARQALHPFNPFTTFPRLWSSQDFLSRLGNGGMIRLAKANYISADPLIAMPQHRIKSRRSLAIAFECRVPDRAVPDGA